MYVRDGVWHREITDERAGVMESSRREFATEEEALDDALETARGGGGIQLELPQTVQWLLNNGYIKEVRP
ncbi:hypothetical protein AB1K54_16000 [Microbacterium sp. BWT-B31]|uniref:hypothetical protein n=1 Tax=Microbacterium sp. BWT-B31 TaxID=3232072 RepID=UPI003529ABFB